MALTYKRRPDDDADRWKGKRAIILARQSNDATGTDSVDAQASTLRARCAEQGMTVVDTVLMAGLSGSAPARRSDIDALFTRKAKANDFDVIAVQVEDRLTRGGGGHGMWLEHECRRRGIEVFISTQTVQDGLPYSDVIKVLSYSAANEQVKGTARRAAQNQQFAIVNGLHRTAGQTPYGCDRMVFSAEGKPRFVIRSLCNGLQEQRDPETGELLATFGTPEKRSRNRFKKQKNEFTLLVPGDPEQVRIVRIIFYLRFHRGWRGARIADLLNRCGVRSPKGKTWGPRQVESLYENESYLGFIDHGKTFSGRFVRRDATYGYAELHRDQIELDTRKFFTPVYRPRNEWMRVAQPRMVDYLPAHTRQLAEAAYEELWRRRLDPSTPVRKWTPRPGSEFHLSGRLICEQDGERLVGTLSGPAHYKVRYYRSKRARRERRRGAYWGNLIAADPLHAAVLHQLGQVLLSAPELRPGLVALVEERRASLAQQQPGIAELEAERTDIRRRIEAIVTTLCGAALEDNRPQLERLGRRRNEIEAELAALSSGKHPAATASTEGARENGGTRVDAGSLEPAEVVADRVIASLTDLGGQIGRLSPEVVHQLFADFVHSARVDMETKAVTVELSIPGWHLEAPPTPMNPARKRTKRSPSDEEAASNHLCPTTSLRSQAVDQTQIVVATLRCRYERVVGSHTLPPCYVCSREARKALVETRTEAAADSLLKDRST